MEEFWELVPGDYPYGPGSFIYIAQKIKQRTKR